MSEELKRFREDYRLKIRDKIQKAVNSEEDCEDCRVSVGVGMALNLGNSLGYSDCDELYNKVINEEIEADTVVDTFINRSEGKEEQRKFKEIKRMMHTPL